MNSKLLSWGLCFLVLVASSLLRAADLPPPLTFDLPFDSTQAVPDWLGKPEILPTTFAALNLPIKDVDPNASLLLTLCFDEKKGGFLRIIWQGPAGAQLLSDNFYEGIGMKNQRSLLISPETLAGGGMLTLQCGDTTLGVQRIKLQFLESGSALVHPGMQDVLVTPEEGWTKPAQALNGQPKSPDVAAWKGKVVTVPVTQSPQRIEQGVEFSVQLDSNPGSGRLVLKEAGLPLGKHLAVWINRERAGTISPSTPDLNDEGYVNNDIPEEIFVGWREGSFYLPSKVLKEGVNTVQFSVEDEVPATDAITALAPTAPLAVKDVVFQVNYPPLPQDNLSVTQPQIRAVPVSDPPPSSTSPENKPQ